MIKLTNVSKTYYKDGKEIPALKDINLEIDKGEIFGMIGYSGAGKSTLIRLFNLLEKPTTGSILIDNQILNELSENELQSARKEIGMIFQHFNLLWSRTVIENIEFPLELSGMKKAERRKRVLELIELVGLTGRENNFPSELSGGQKQRVGIARALATNPKVILADESTSALDPDTTDQILELLQKINQELGITIVLITHEMHVIKQICHRVAVIDKGSIVEIGDVLEVFQQPKAEITKRFLGQVDDDEEGELFIDEFKKNFPNSKIIVCRFIADSYLEVGKPITATLARTFLEVDFHVLHVSNVRTVEGLYARLTLQIVGTEAKINEVLDYLTDDLVVKYEEV